RLILGILLRIAHASVKVVFIFLFIIVIIVIIVVIVVVNLAKELSPDYLTHRSLRTALCFELTFRFAAAVTGGLVSAEIPTRLITGRIGGVSPRSRSGAG